MTKKKTAPPVDKPVDNLDIYTWRNRVTKALLAAGCDDPEGCAGECLVRKTPLSGAVSYQLGENEWVAQVEGDNLVAMPLEVFDVTVEGFRIYPDTTNSVLILEPCVFMPIRELKKP